MSTATDTQPSSPAPSQREQPPCIKLREKVFRLQDSKLTQMFVSHHVKSSFNLIFAIVFWTLLLNVAFFATHSHEFYALLSFVHFTFQHLTDLLFFDLVFHVVIFSVIYPLTKLWVTRRHQTNDHKKPTDGKLLALDFVYGLTVGIVFTLVYAFSLYLIYVRDLSVAIRTAILSEKVRLTMKVIAFIIESRRKQETSQDKDSEKVKLTFSSPGKLLYFLFAPTIVYRDEYPRTKRIRWQFVATYAFQFALGLAILCVLFHRILIPSFSSLGSESIPMKDLIALLFFSLMIGAILQILGFYMFLHCWMNLWAELLRFGDRTFYLDWWNSTNYTTFYRKWNCVVHDWIYAYFYAWIVNKTGSKVISALSVFVVSSLIHEYILSVSFGFIYPVLTIQFAGMGTILYIGEVLYKKLTNRLQSSKPIESKPSPDTIDRPSNGLFYTSNFLIMASVINGWVSMLVLYSFEYFSRQNCVLPSNSWFENLYTLYTFQCIKIH